MRPEPLDSAGAAIAALAAASLRSGLTVTVNLDALAGLLAVGTDRIHPRLARVVPFEGDTYELPLDGRPLGAPGEIRYVYVHNAVYAKLMGISP